MTIASNRHREYKKRYLEANSSLTYMKWLEKELEELESEKSLATIAGALEKLAGCYQDLRFNFDYVHHSRCAELRNEATRAREHAELVTSLLEYVRKKGNMPRNWRSLTIGELVGFATTLPRIESLGDLSEIPIMSEREADFIRMMETLARCGLEKKELPKHDPCNWWWNIKSGAFWTLLRKAKAMLKVQ